MKAKKRTKEYLLKMARDISDVSAKDSGNISYTAQMMVNTGFPCRNLGVNEFVRVNGRSRLTILSPSEIGIPYGTYPRILMIWLVTQAKIRKSREVYLGESVSEFVRNIGKSSSGGPGGSLTMLKMQSQRLFSSTICFTQNGDEKFIVKNINIAQEASVIWSNNSEHLWSSNIRLSENFYDDVQASAVPIDMRVIEA